MLENIFWISISFGCGIVATLLYLIKFGCIHKYETIDQNVVKYFHNGSNATKIVYTNRCKHCGKLKMVDLK